MEIPRALHVHLTDNEPEHNSPRHLVVSTDQNFIQIEAAGYNACNSADDNRPGNGYMAIASIEVWEGELRLIVWSDINQEDPTHIISLEGARITARKCEYCGGSCPSDHDYACDGFVGDIDGLYSEEA